MAEPRDYLAYGLSIRSQLAVPGAMDIPHAAAPDIAIEEGPAVLEAPYTELAPFRRAGNKFLIEQAGVARYLCEDGRRIVVEPMPDAAPAIVSAALIATALPVALYQRGEAVLHAAVARLPGAARALAIAGHSGSGKSTVLGQLVTLGASVAADDTACLRLCGESVEASGLPAGYFLGNGGTGRDLVPVPPAQQSPLLALGAVVALAPREGRGFRRLQGAEAVAELLRQTHRARAARFLGCEPHLLPLYSRLVGRIAVYTWSRRPDTLNLTDDEREALQAMGSERAA